MMNTFAENYDARILDASIRSMYGGDYYNVGDWSGECETLAQACAALADRHIGHLQPKSGDRIVDIGCGLGAAANRLAQAHPTVDVIGANISHAQLNYARTRYPSVDFCVMNASSLAIANQSLNGILSIEAAIHFPSRMDFLREAHRALKPGGRIVYSDILFNDIGPLGDWWIPEGTSKTTRSEYASMCLQAGFDVLLIDDIAEITWQPFCRFLGCQIDDVGYADRLSRAVDAYLLLVLEKSDWRAVCCDSSMDMDRAHSKYAGLIATS